MGRTKHFWGLAAVLSLTLLIFSLLPLRTAFELGDDEGYEVIKGFMCFKGFKLYDQIWNDQPPVETMLLSAAFKVFGPTIGTARMIAAGFGLLFVGAFFELVRRRSGQITAFLSAFFLLSAPGVLLLSVSVMLEVPAFATALLAVGFLDRWRKRRTIAWLLASGAIMGIALQIKLTSVIVVPGLLFELLLAYWAPKAAADQVGSGRIQKRAAKQKANVPASANVPESARKTALRVREVAPPFMGWCVTVVAMFLLIGMTWGKGALESSWKSHTKTQDIPNMERAEDHVFEPLLVKNHVECIMGAILCVLMALWKKRMREIAFPVILLLTASAIHAFHRPWWNYYYLHFALPLCWLTGLIASAMVRGLNSLQFNRGDKLSSAATCKGFTLCILVAAAVARSERRIESNIKNIRERQTADSNPIVTKMKAAAPRPSWVYSESGSYAFHAKLAVPPELAVIALKRFWSGQLTREEIVNSCGRYKPEMIVLPRSAPNGEWAEFLKKNYQLISMDQHSMLYVANR